MRAQGFIQSNELQRQIEEERRKARDAIAAEHTKREAELQEMIRKQEEAMRATEEEVLIVDSCSQRYAHPTTLCAVPVASGAAS